MAEHDQRQPMAPDPDAFDPERRHGERRRAPPGRFEVRVRPRGSAWDVTAGQEAPRGLYASRLVALKQARELARVRWAETGMLTCVKTLSPEGTWVVDEIHGIDRRRQRRRSAWA